MHSHEYFTDYLCYDDGCHLKKYACNEKRKYVTTTTKWMSEMKIVVDKLHFRGHVDKWCHENCNPHDFDALRTVRIYMHVHQLHM